jgi:hypothetical protein
LTSRTAFAVVFAAGSGQARAAVPDAVTVEQVAVCFAPILLKHLVCREVQFF